MIKEYILKFFKRLIGILKFIEWKLFFGKRLSCGKRTFFYPGCNIMIENTGSIKIGDNCFFNNRCSMTAIDMITIGNNCILGEDIKIYDHNHKFEVSDVPFRKQGYTVGKVTIGDNVWIGSNSIILPGVTIGNNVVIAAMSVVNKSIPDNTVYIQKRNTYIVEKGKKDAAF